MARFQLTFAESDQLAKHAELLPTQIAMREGQGVITESSRPAMDKARPAPASAGSTDASLGQVSPSMVVTTSAGLTNGSSSDPPF